VVAPGNGVPMIELISAKRLSTIVLGNNRNLTSSHLTTTPTKLVSMSQPPAD
jgi:hypothetical protein